MPGNKIKVIHLIPSFWTGHGPSSGILAQIQAHAPRDFDFAIWSLYAPPPELDPRNLLQQAGLAYRVLPMSRSFLDVRVLAPLVRHLRRERPDVLHCHLVRANLYGPMAARLAGIPAVICTFRGIDAYVTSSGLLPAAIRLVERLTSTWVSRYVAVSETARQAIIKHLHLSPGKIVTILNAVDLSPFAPVRRDRPGFRAALGLPPEAVVLGSVGRLSPLKNYANLIRWLADLAPIFPQAHLLLVGDGPERPALETLIRDLGLTPRVHLLGHREDVPELLPLMDVFALPSLSEGLPRAVMEAMAAGLPCVVMDAGGNSEAVVEGQTGYVAPLEDGVKFTEGLTRLLEDEGLRKKLGTAGKKRAFALFNPKRLAAQYEELYRSVLNLGPGRRG